MNMLITVAAFLAVAAEDAASALVSAGKITAYAFWYLCKPVWA